MHCYSQGCVNALNFNQNGNLLASASDDLAVGIWDWATGKKRHWFESGHIRNIFQVCIWINKDAYIHSYLVLIDNTYAIIILHV